MTLKHKELQRATNKLDAWAAERGLNFFTSKMVNMVFRKRRKKNKESIEIIPNKYQFLGMTLDSRLNWEEHIDRVRAKGERALSTIKMVAGKK